MTLTQDQINQIQGIVIDQLNGFNMPPVAVHSHNGWDANLLDPIVSLTGFPVYQVADASVAPTDQSDNGKFRYLVDFSAGTPHYYLWSYLVYRNLTNQQVAKWVGVPVGATSAPGARFLTGSSSYAGGVFPPGSTGGTTVPVTGALNGDFAVGSYSTSLGGLYISASVSSVGNVEVIFANLGGATVTLASGTLSALVIQYP